MGEVREFALPDLGEGLTEATVVRWLVAVGDTVAVDEPVVEVETAKAMVEVPCPYGGVVTAHMAEEGAEVPVGSPLVTVAVVVPGEPSPDARPGEGPAGASAAAPGSPELEHVGGSGNVLVGYGTRPAPRRRRRVSGLGSPAQSDGAAPSEQPTRAGTAREPGTAVRENTRDNTAVRDNAAVRENTAPREHSAVRRTQSALGPVPVISPLVRRLAREHGLDLHAVRGTGPEGLILRADVERAAASAPGDTDHEALPQRDHAATPAADGSVCAGIGTGAGVGAGAGVGERIPLRGMRGTAADRFTRSRTEIPDASCWVDADATELLAFRKEMNAPPAHAAQNAGEAHGARPPVSLLALLGRVCTAALARFPVLNSTVDATAREIVVLPRVHLGFAAQTDRGLVVPVVRDAHTLSAEQLSTEMARLTESARTSTLTPAELTGGTFTLNNYGVFGVDGSTPIINHPEAAMLGVGRIAPKPWVVGGELAVRHVVQLSFTFDHRVCDGGTAGGFLRYVADCVEHPATLLRTL